jgi:drug/metabolite transporter (DMT)-like permease
VTADSSGSRAIPLTAAALVAFAANSVLCRIALREGAVDAASFTTIRIASGAAMLLLLTAPGRRPVAPLSGSWSAAGLLALYAVPFAFAYTRLSVGTGALILFGCVQVTMLGAALRSEDRPRPLQWTGAALAVAGLVTLVLPGLTAPPPDAALLMAAAGVAWGIYSLRGRVTSNPLLQTTGNFVRAVPLVGAASLLTLPAVHVETKGVLLSVLSGALASGLGYVVWYAALRGLTRTYAAVVQLAVPLLAAAGGILFLRETVSLRLLVSAVMVLGGIATAILGGTAGATVPALSRR